MQNTTDIYNEILETARNKNYYSFEDKVMKYMKYDNYIFILSLKSWYTIFSKKCLNFGCYKELHMYKEGENIIYHCESCNLQYSYFYKHTEEEYLKKTFINKLLC